ncbi:MAG: hypothetical protein ACRD8Z_11925 [Nitrososphaeraceae archaeon]
MTLMNLNTINSVFAMKSNCDAKIQPMFGCPLGSDNQGTFAIASAKTVEGEKESHSIDIGAIDSTSDISIIISKNNEGDVKPNIESQIPSTISAIPFP